MERSRKKKKTWISQQPYHPELDSRWPKSKINNRDSNFSKPSGLSFTTEVGWIFFREGSCSFNHKIPSGFAYGIPRFRPYVGEEKKIYPQAGDEAWLQAFQSNDVSSNLQDWPHYVVTEFAAHRHQSYCLLVALENSNLLSATCTGAPQAKQSSLLGIYILQLAAKHAKQQHHSSYMLFFGWPFTLPYFHPSNSWKKTTLLAFPKFQPNSVWRQASLVTQSYFRHFGLGKKNTASLPLFLPDSNPGLPQKTRHRWSGLNLKKLRTAPVVEQGIQMWEHILSQFYKWALK